MDTKRRLASWREREGGIYVTTPPLLVSLNRAKTEGFGVFNFFFRLIFFLFLIAVLGGATSFHTVSLSIICLVIYFFIYLVYNFFCWWLTDRRREDFIASSLLFPPFFNPYHSTCLIPLFVSTSSCLLFMNSVSDVLYKLEVYFLKQLKVFINDSFPPPFLVFWSLHTHFLCITLAGFLNITIGRLNIV